jgi:glucose-6-phosphate 1-epimerase
MSAPQLITTPYVPPARPVLIAGNGGLPKLLLRARDGASAELYLHGGQLTSWKPAGDGQERIFLSSAAEFREGGAIRGGVPVIFPQFGAEGRLSRHGFARNMEWSLVNARETTAGAATVTLRLTDSRESWALWRHRFSIELTVVLLGQTLELRLRIANDGRKPFRFTGALHSYLRVTEIADVTLAGLQGCRYRDLTDGSETLDPEPELKVVGELDRIYFGVRTPLQLRAPQWPLRIEVSGFPDVVVWNPGSMRAAQLADLEVEGYRRMLCVEAAVVGEPVWLAPGDAWQGMQRLSTAEVNG